MRGPIPNEYGSELPPQQAAAAAQHPMLAPRPADPVAMGYPSFPSQMHSSAQLQPINTPSFYYPAQVQPSSHIWHIQPIAQTGNTLVPPNVTDFPQVQQSVQLGQTSTPHRPYESVQNVPQIATPIGQTAEEYASNLSPMPAFSSMHGRRESETNPVPQVCIAIFSVFSSWYAEYDFLDDPTAAYDISLSATARAITAATTIS